MTPASYVLLRHQTFYFRCRMPQGLTARFARRELVRSLQTRDWRTAQLRVSVMALKLPRLWESLSMASDTAELERLIDHWFAQEVVRQWRLLPGYASALYADDSGENERREMDRRYYSSDAEFAIEKIAKSYAHGHYEAEKPIAQLINAQLHSPLSEDSREFTVLCKRVLEARGEIEEARIRWAAGEVEYRPARGRLSVVPPTVEPAQEVKELSSGRSLGEAIKLFLDLQKLRSNPTDRALTQKAGELRILTDAFGSEILVEKITSREAGRIFEALQFLPKNYRQRPELSGLSFFDLVQKAREEGIDALHARTINGYLTTMRMLFEQERKAGHITANPFEGLQVKVGGDTESDRGFEPEEIAAIFGSPLFQGAASEHLAYASGSLFISDWRFWSPLIALLTGARVAEIAQLRPTDIHQYAGHWVVDINDDEGRRLKTTASKRLIPLHHELLRLDLPLLARARSEAGYTRLLPGVGKPQGGDAGAPLSKWMSERFLPRFSLEKRSGLGFHSFRHHMASALRSAEIDGRIADRILGHSSEGQGARYGRFTLETLSQAINSIKLPDVVQAIPVRPPRR